MLALIKRHLTEIVFIIIILSIVYLHLQGV